MNQISWFTIAAYAGRFFSPQAQAVEDDATKRAMGETPTMSIDDIIAFVNRRLCYGAKTGQSCNHQRCATAASLLGWLIAEQQAEQRVAA